MSIEDAADFHFWRAHDLSHQDRYKEALAHLDAALEIEPRHIQALILAGEMYLFAEFGGLQVESQSEADETALQYFERALAVEPRSAEAWAEKALALLHLERYQESLDAADQGLLVLPECIGYAMTYEPVHTNVAEAVFDVKVRALLELGRKNEARQVLKDGLEYCSGSEFLSRLFREFMPGG